MITIKNNEDCSGCQACAAICPKQCISMDSDSEGFWYPAVDVSLCIDCDACVRVCPILHHKPQTHEPKALACYSRNDRIRFLSSSGGLFTIIAKHIVQDGGVVFGASYNDSMQVVHDYATTNDELKKFRGSKYVQSYIGNAYQQAESFLAQGRKVLFSGTPCQISGLKAYLSKPYEHLFCIDLICHGVPSPKVFKKYVLSQEITAGKKVTRIAFRYKKLGWKHACVLIAYDDDTRTVQKSIDNTYMWLYRKNIMLRPSCYSCRFKQAGRESDLTLADFWGIQKVMPEMDDDKGISLLMVQSDAGSQMVSKIDPQIVSREVPCQVALSHNRSALRSTICHPNRSLFFEKLDDMPLRELSRLCLKQTSDDTPDANEEKNE